LEPENADQACPRSARALAGLELSQCRPSRLAADYGVRAANGGQRIRYVLARTGRSAGLPPEDRYETAVRGSVARGKRCIGGDLKPLIDVNYSGQRMVLLSETLVTREDSNLNQTVMSEPRYPERAGKPNDFDIDLMPLVHV
jgi:hypothetical protein